MKRIKDLELANASKSTFFNSFYVRGYYVDYGGNRYLTFAKKMADACENVWKITKETNIYENERKYVFPADKQKEVQIRRPFWWYGRVYLVTSATDICEECKEGKWYEENGKCERCKL